MYKVYFITFGCKVNHYETECMKKSFTEDGFTVSDTAAGSDVIVINSCTVTSSSDKKVMQTLRKLRHENPDSIIVLTGCWPQAFESEAQKVKEANVITGTKDRGELTRLVRKALEDHERTVDIKPYTGKESMEPMTCSSFEKKVCRQDTARAMPYPLHRLSIMVSL